MPEALKAQERSGTGNARCQQEWICWPTPLLIACIGICACSSRATSPPTSDASTDGALYTGSVDGRTLTELC
jgi:hypothetical protein